MIKRVDRKPNKKNKEKREREKEKERREEKEREKEKVKNRRQEAKTISAVYSIDRRRSFPSFRLNYLLRCFIFSLLFIDFSSSPFSLHFCFHFYLLFFFRLFYFFFSFFLFLFCFYSYYRVELLRRSPSLLESERERSDGESSPTRLPSRTAPPSSTLRRARRTPRSPSPRSTFRSPSSCLFFFR